MLEDRVDVIPYGKDNLLILCPFHSESNPSCSVHSKTGGFQCFSCGEKGNFVKLLSQLDNISESRAKELLHQDFSADRLIDQIEQQVLNLSDRVPQKRRYLNKSVFHTIFPKLDQVSLDYLHSRKINDSVIELFDLRQGIELTYASRDKRLNKKWKSRILFPFYDLKKRLVGFGGRRVFDTMKPKVKKCVSYKGAGKTFLYGLNHLYKGKKLPYLILGESDIDTLYLQQFGLNAVAAWAVGSLSNIQMSLILQSTDLLILNYNNRYIDQAGQKATERELQNMKKYLPTIVCDFPKGKKDANELTIKEVKKVYMSLLKRLKINTKGVKL